MQSHGETRWWGRRQQVRRSTRCRKETVKKGDTSGYFVSLSGFTETARQQELDLPTSRLVLLGPQDILDQLVHGGIVASLEVAAEQAGRCVGGREDLELDGPHDLLAHDLGWVWAIFFGRTERGERMCSSTLTDTPWRLPWRLRSKWLIARVDGPLSRLTLIAPEPSIAGMSRHDPASTRDAYLRYVGAEYGSITLEGLPADQEVTGPEACVSMLSTCHSTSTPSRATVRGPPQRERLLAGTSPSVN